MRKVHEQTLLDRRSRQVRFRTELVRRQRIWGFRCGEDGAEADDDPDEVERDGGPGASFPTAKGEECSSDDVDPVESSRLASEPSAGNQHVSQQQCASSNPTAQLTNQRWTRTSLRDSERMDN